MGNRSFIERIQSNVAKELHKAIERGDYQTVAKILNLKAKLVANVTLDEDGYTILQAAVSHGNGEIVEMLIKAGADVNKASNDGLTPLHYAAAHRSNEAVEKLIEAGADVNMVDFSQDDYAGGSTPLHVAVGMGDIEIVKMLIKAGAKINEPDNDGLTPLNIAVCDIKETLKSGKALLVDEKTEIVKLLLNELGLSEELQLA